jgi:Leucine-rich repeat (LRR) protein
VVHAQQLQAFTADKVQQLTAAVNKLKRLRIVQPGASGRMAEASAEQLAGLGACRQLEEVNIHCWIDKPWWGLGQDINSSSTTTSSSSSRAVAGPLRSWRSAHVTPQLFTDWAPQQVVQHTLTGLHLEAGSKEVDLSGLPALAGLKELTLTTSNTIFSPSSLSTITSLTLLQAPASDGLMKAACGLTGLRQLSLEGSRSFRQLPSAMQALVQLTGLSLVSIAVPPDLGVWLPSVQRLEVSGIFQLELVPASLTRLTHLNLAGNTGRSLNLPAALAGLKQLVTPAADYTSFKGLNHLTALEVLDVSFTTAQGSGWADLQALTRLRHCDILGWSGLQPDSLAVVGALQQLTYLAVTVPSGAHWATPRPLPALQELHMWGASPDSSLAVLGPWLSQLTAVTGLHVVRLVVEAIDKLDYLPVGLRHLRLSSTEGLKRLPWGVQTLSALECLDVSNNPGVFYLPLWLSSLRCLRVLDLDETGVVTQQQVLGHMPQLRVVRLHADASAAAVFGAASHLHFEHGMQELDRLAAVAKNPTSWGLNM